MRRLLDRSCCKVPVGFLTACIMMRYSRNTGTGQNHCSGLQAWGWVGRVGTTPGLFQCSTWLGRGLQGPATPGRQGSFQKPVLVLDKARLQRRPHVVERRHWGVRHPSPCCTGVGGAAPGYPRAAAGKACWGERGALGALEARGPRGHGGYLGG